MPHPRGHGSDRQGRARHSQNDGGKRLRDLSTSSQDSFTREMRHNDLFDESGLDVVRKGQRAADAAKAASYRPPKALDSNPSDSEDTKEFKRLNQRIIDRKEEEAKRAAKKAKTAPAKARADTPAKIDANDGTTAGMAKLNLSDKPPRVRRNEERVDARGQSASGDVSAKTGESASKPKTGDIVSRTEPSSRARKPKPARATVIGNHDRADKEKGGCFSIDEGQHFKSEEYTSTTDGKKKTRYWCSVSSKCKKDHTYSNLEDVKTHIKADHMESLCGFIGTRDKRAEHVKTKKCHEGSQRRKNVEADAKRYESRDSRKKEAKAAASTSTSTGGSK